MRKVIIVNDLMQTNYQYELVAPIGQHFHPDFKPQLSPQALLALGVFGGKYMTDCINEFPSEWFAKAKLCHAFHDPSLNFFGVNASQPLHVWQQKGWLYKDDPRGWFQWYARYFFGRRLTDGEDERQIKRWRLFRRHLVQVERNCLPGDYACRRVQRQALLHWAYDARSV